MAINRMTTPKTRLQTADQAAGAVFLLVGVLGFIPGITSNYDTLRFAGHGSAALLLGIFQVSVLHNIVHLLFGHDTPLNFVPVHNADNWLHLILGAAMITLAVLLTRNTEPRH